MNKNLELLAPVGSFDSLKAAVQNGANAVYLGGKNFGARASANNFDNEELKEAVRYAHIRGCRVFITVNTLIKQSEKEDFLEYIDYLYEIQIDALILQDIGMAKMIQKIHPDFELHASTQMAAHSLSDVRHLEEVGFKRVVLARELNVDEIKEITANTKVDIEVFVHGALCVCYSGECLMSSELGTRSGNRGRCAQPCRQKYKLYNIDEDKYMDIEDEYLLSPRDLNTIENIGRIIDTNVLSLKIEGRMKRPEYVATVISAYREAIVNYLDSGKSKVTEEKMDELYTIFNRKFTHGYILGEVGAELMNAQKPNNRGLYIGKTLSYNRKAKRLKLGLERPLKKGDGLSIGGGTVGRIIKGREITESAEAGEIIEIDYIGDVRLHMDVYKTSDSRLMTRVRKTYEEDKEYVKIPIRANLFINKGEVAVLTLTDDEGRTVSATGEKIVEKALKVALNEEKARKQIAKLGNTPFELEEFEAYIDEDASLPMSELNNIRRAAIDLLCEERVRVDRTPNKSKEEPIKAEYTFDDKIRVNVSCKNLEQLEEVLKMDVDSIYYRDVYTLEKAIEMAGEKKLIFYMPRIIRNNENLYASLEKVGNIDKLEGFRVSNYGEIYNLRKKYNNPSIFISPWMNVFNDYSLNYYKSLGVKKVCLSQEMSLMQIRGLEEAELPLEYLAYGKVEMMVSEYCPMGVLTKDCRKNKRDAMCRKSVYALESSNGDKYRLAQDINCRTTIYSDQVVNLIDEIGEMSQAGINELEIALSFENIREVKEVVSKFIQAAQIYTEDERSNPSIVINLKKEFSTGHLYKEID